MADTIQFNTISEIHHTLGLGKPKHPLVTVVHGKDIKSVGGFHDVKIVMNLYRVELKQGSCGIIRYGRNSYDYQNGSLIFTAPGQIIEFENVIDPETEDLEGWTLGFHPDLIRKSNLADKISKYSFFNYDVSEALHLSEDELKTIEELLDKIIKEYSQNLDRHSQSLIISNIELLLDYCTRFYDRQFYTRSNQNTDMVSKFERLIKNYFNEDLPSEFGKPTVSFCANELGLSSNYLSDMLKKETGKTAQEHIHLFLIDRAKNILLNSSYSVSEIAYQLGFEYPQHFSNLFKAKTGYSPRAFRSLN